MSIMAWTDTYEQIVYYMEATFTDRYNTANYVYQIMLLLVDLEQSDELGVEASTQLLPETKKFHNWVVRYMDIDSRRQQFIYKINKFTEDNKGDLTTFVNSISWIENCIPYYWGSCSENNHIDTSDWLICS